MAHYDVFNGDADGICALQQLRLATPITSQLITGVKRDIQLLRQVTVTQDDTVTVLDISLDKNRDDVLRIIESGARIEYFDHHYAGDLPEHAALTTHIDTSANTCTSMLVNQFLQGKYVNWAIAGAYGDNLYDSADLMADDQGLSKAQRELLKELGTYLNYNGYGASLDDLYFTPDVLYKKVSPYADPFDFIAKDEAFLTLKN
ncbi:MAG: acetyltransferase, partial [Gammaproteobacteria bacterium]|nr:acetyltransferase [Gammaproteobacteria bacterium]